MHPRRRRRPPRICARSSPIDARYAPPDRPSRAPPPTPPPRARGDWSSRSSPRGYPSPRWSDVAETESTTTETETKTKTKTKTTTTTRTFARRCLRVGLWFLSRGRARARRRRRVSPPPRSPPRRRATFWVRRSISTRPSRRCVASRPARGSPRRRYAPRSTRREPEFEPDVEPESRSGLAATRRRRRPSRTRLERRRLARVSSFGRLSDDSVAARTTVPRRDRRRIRLAPSPIPRRRAARRPPTVRFCSTPDSTCSCPVSDPRCYPRSAPRRPRRRPARSEVPWRSRDSPRTRFTARASTRRCPINSASPR